MQSFIRENSKIFLFFLVIFLFSSIIKFNNIQSFLETENVFATYDAFRYARFAREVAQQTYSPIDYLVDVPDYRISQNPPYLLSLIAAKLSGLFNVRLEFLFAVIPPIFSLFFIIPLYHWLKTFTRVSMLPAAFELRKGAGGILKRLAASLDFFDDKTLLLYLFAGGAFLGIFNFIYAIRTSPGYFDTDCLILTFVFSLLLLVTLAVAERDRELRSCVWIVSAGLLLRVFFWWYDVFIFAPYFTFSLVAGLIAFRHSWKSVLLKTGLFVAVINPATLWYGLNIQEYLFAVFMKEKLTLLPVSIFSTINEFRPINLSQFVGFTTENVGTAVLAIAGLLLLGIRYPRHILIALPIILTGLSTFKSGNRYIMYLAPFLGMGLGYTIYILIGLLNKRFLQYRRHIVCLGIVLTVFLAFPPQRIHYYPVPYMSRELFSDFKLLKDITEKDAYIWTWWDHGFAIEYLAERGTYVDGGNYHPAKLLFIARSFMTDNELTSKQTISFVTNNLTGEYLFSGQAVSKIVEQSSSYGALPNRQVYIVIDRMMMEYPFLQSLGFSGDFKEGQDLNLFQEAKKCRQLDVSQLSNVETRSLSQSSDDRHDCYFFHVSIPSGEISIPEGKSDIRDIFREILYIDRKEGRAVVLHHNSQSFSQKILQIIKNKRGDLYFMVADLAVRHSIMNRMYALSDSFEHFELVLDDFPHLVAYKVKRDVH